MNIAIQRSQRKTLQLSVTSSGDVLIRAPMRLPQSQIEHFIRQKQDWIDRAIMRQGQRIALPCSTTEFKNYAPAIKRMVLARLHYFNQSYGFQWKKITIRNSRGRWGSCSRQKNLNFNYRLRYLPAAIQDYIIVHELCHLQEMNHRKKFWDLVGRTIPDYAQRRAVLKRYAL